MKLNSLIAVTGATGIQGGAVAHQLLDRGVPVRALTRNPESAAAHKLRAQGAEVVYADFAEPTTLKNAFHNARAVFLMSTPFGTSPQTETAQGIAAIDAAQAMGVEQLVFSSVAHADRNTGIPHFESKYAIEQHLSASNLNWTIIGPAKFLDNFASGYSYKLLAQGQLALPLSPHKPVALICAQDIAGMAVLALAEPQRLAKLRIDIAGEELTGEELAGVFQHAIGHTVSYEQVPREVSRKWGHDIETMFHYFNTVGLDVNTTHLRATFPEVNWRTAAEWANTIDWTTEIAGVK